MPGVHFRQLIENTFNFSYHNRERFKHYICLVELNGFLLKMEKLQSFYYFLELAGTFAFAISGAVAARQRGLDLFGICALAFTGAGGKFTAGTILFKLVLFRRQGRLWGS